MRINFKRQRYCESQMAWAMKDRGSKCMPLADLHLQANVASTNSRSHLGRCEWAHRDAPTGPPCPRPMMAPPLCPAAGVSLLRGHPLTEDHRPRQATSPDQHFGDSRSPRGAYRFMSLSLPRPPLCMPQTRSIIEKLSTDVI